MASRCFLNPPLGHPIKFFLFFKEFVARTGRNHLIVGNLVPITFEDIAEISQAARLLGSDLFEAVSKKYFDVPSNALTGILRRGKQASKTKRKDLSKKTVVVKTSKKSSHVKRH
jgi:hypothetical protein